MMLLRIEYDALASALVLAVQQVQVIQRVVVV